MILPSRLHISTTRVALGIVLAAAAPTAHAQPGTGAPYGARDARPCKLPAPRGTPSAAQAAAAVVCETEGIHPASSGPMLSLVEQVRVEVGRGRRYEAYQFPNATDIDPSALVYPIRGSQVRYSCSTRRSQQDELGGDPNRNCTAFDETTAEGMCYTTSFGQLTCSMSNTPPLSLQQWRRDVAPPR